jgi:hypothetical protein
MPSLELIWLLAAALLATFALGLTFAVWRREGAANVVHATPTLSAAEVSEQHRFATIGATRFGEPIELSGTL